MSEADFPFFVTLKICYFQIGIRDHGLILVEGKVYGKTQELLDGKHIKVCMWLRDYDVKTGDLKTKNLDIHNLAMAESVKIRFKFSDPVLSDLGQVMLPCLVANEIVEYNFPFHKIENLDSEDQFHERNKSVKIRLGTLMFLKKMSKIVIIGQSLAKIPSNKPFLSDWEYCKIEFEVGHPNFNLNKITNSKYLEVAIEETLIVGLLPYPWYRSEKEVKIFEGKSVLNYFEDFNYK